MLFYACYGVKVLRFDMARAWLGHGKAGTGLASDRVGGPRGGLGCGTHMPSFPKKNLLFK